MKRTPSVCQAIEPDLIALAMREAKPAAARRVEDHVARCRPCQGELERYRAIDGMVDTLRDESLPAAQEALAHHQLEARLADLRRRQVAYRVFPSPLGRLLIARSEQGILLVEYLASGAGFRASRLSREEHMEAVEDGPEIETLYRELLDYLQGKRSRFEWPLDLRLARTDFHRTVLKATSKIPYGAVVSYTGIACKVGNPEAARAVAQALRWNPLPILIPCHRVIGSSDSLTGYAGNRIDLKQRLLAGEGVPIVKAGRAFQIARQVMYVLYPDDEEYCVPTCPSLRSVAAARLTLFGLRERAEAAGLRPCTSCRPDLHPISH